ncbi:hypothetical protein [Undibacterium sp. Di24W]|uniref:hypothetical protein n=1 Tax=Undibacterium sp. Di24W TaxID=3413033 RepID=UPI003BF337DF
MRFLYPCDPFNKKKPDEAYEEDFLAAQAAGLSCSLYSAEDFEQGEFSHVGRVQPARYIGRSNHTHWIGGAGCTRPTEEQLDSTISSLQNLEVGCTVERAKSGLNIPTQSKDDQTKSFAAALAATLPSSVGTK